MRAKKIAYAPQLVAVAAVLSLWGWARSGAAQDVPPSFSFVELERIVAPIALYPDPLLAQVLAAATFADDIPDAFRWADDHHYLRGRRLTDAITADHLPWDQSVQALLPFPSVLERMASDLSWTEQLGDAFLAQPEEVMDAVQRVRRRANDFGYLRSCRPVVVRLGPYVEIVPADPWFIVVPHYDPRILFVPPVPGGDFVPASAVYCGYGVGLGVWAVPWGWGSTRVVWPTRTIIIKSTPWKRAWTKRPPKVVPKLVPPSKPFDPHKAKPRTPKERARELPKAVKPGGKK